MYGLKDHHIAAIRSVFQAFPQIEKAILYGSRALGTYRHGSDIDLVLLGPQLDLTLLHRIEIELDELLLAYKIDLAIFHHIQNPELLEHIRRAGVVFYEKTSSSLPQS